ncbi:MAG: amidohydrolase family protein, partial [Planctomycetota bacterium]
IETGKLADLTVLDLDDVGTIPGDDIYARIVYAAQSRHVHSVFVGGRCVVDAGQLTTLNEASVRANAWEERRRLETRIQGFLG